MINQSIVRGGLVAAITLLSAALSPMLAREAQETDTLRLSLDDCIRISLDENPSIKVADAEIDRMDLTKKSTIGQLLPNISFAGQYSRTLAKQTMYMNMDAFGGGAAGGEGSEESTTTSKSSKKDSGFKVGLDNSWSLGFNASMPLISPQLWATLKLNDAQIMASVENARNSRISMIREVKAAYYALLLAEDSRKVIESNYDMALYTASIYKKRFEMGTASQFDTLRTSVAVKNIEPQLTQSQITLRQSQLKLAILMGINGVPTILPTTQLADYEATMYDDVINISTEIDNNPQLRLLDIQRRQAAQAVKVSKMAFVPTLALTANYNWTGMNNGSLFSVDHRWSPYSTVGLALSIPIFQGGGRLNAVKQNQIAARQLDWQRQDLERSVRMQADIAMDNIQLNVKQIASTALSVKQAEEAYRIICESFDIGTASYLDRRDSEQQLTQSRMAYLQAIYTFLAAKADLEMLLGTAVLPQ